jgi:hypothetical protein
MEERKKFMTYRHEYLIDQIQYMPTKYFRKTDILNNNLDVKISFKNVIVHC